MAGIKTQVSRCRYQDLRFYRKEAKECAKIAKIKALFIVNCPLKA